MLVLSTKDVTKSFGGLTAVNQFSFDLPEGKIYSVIGPNGAGKTTYFNCITGFYEFDDGKIEFMGQVLMGSRLIKLPIWEFPELTKISDCFQT